MSAAVNATSASRQSPEALTADQTRRGIAAQAIGAVFAVILAPSVALNAHFGVSPVILAINAVAMVGFAGSAWLARRRERASRIGVALVGLMLVQHLSLSIVVRGRSDAVTVAVFAALCPLVAAATLRARGTFALGTLGMLGLLAQVALHASSAADATAFSAPLTYYAATWAIATFYSLATDRALAAHSRQEEHTRAAQLAARSAEERYELMAKHLRDLLALLDEDGSYLFASPSFERVLGIAPDSLLGRNAPELVHPDDLGVLQLAFDSAKQSGTATAIARLRGLRGDYRWFHLALSRVAETPKRVLAISARDIHEERVLSAALAQKSRIEALGRLAGGVAHDFNNLLMVMRSCADLMRADLEPNHRARDDLRLLTQAADRAGALTGQLLAFARRQVLPRHEHCVPSQTTHALAPILTRLCGPTVQVQLLTSDSQHAVDASPVQIEQILINLASNAKDAMPNGGGLVLEVRDRILGPDEVEELRPGRYVEIRVQDSGMGIAPEIRAQIFEPFFTTKPPGGGTGLGLATVFGLVSQLGGHVSVQSTVGLGTTFTVLLPESEPKTSDDATPKGAKQEVKSRHVLVVDDDPVVRSLVVRFLRGAGHMATEADSVERALATAEAKGARFDGVVTDVLLGASDGMTILERLQRAQPTASLVVVSGFPPSPDQLAIIAERGAAFLAKPFSASDLLSTLAQTGTANTGQPR